MRGILRKIKKKIKYFWVKCLVALCEENWSDGYNNVKYILKKEKKSDILVIVFSGFAGHYVPARYNYITSLFRLRANKLFVLDNHGYENVGSYYLGDGCSLYNQQTIEKLIQTVADKCKASKMVFAGSSKGGSAALLYGLKLGGDHIICGSPQYQIGTYLNLNDYHKLLYHAICAGTDKTVEWFDALIEKEIQNCNRPVTVDLLYSTEEESYEDDLCCLIEALKGNENITLRECRKTYVNHSSVGAYFRPYLFSVLKEKLD